MKTIIASGVSALVLAAVAVANESAVTDDVIVVTGEKFERTLQDTTSSVAVVDEATIDENNFVTIYDVIKQTANVTSRFNDQGFTIRGIANGGASAGDQTSDVATVYLDGVFIPSALFAQGALNLWDIKTVEVFRGPQSTIQGRNALAGAIVARTVDPGSEFEGAAQVSYAQYETGRASIGATIPLLKDEISLRVSGDFTTSRGYTENTFLNTDDGDRSSSTTARAKLLITPSALPDLTVRLSYNYLDGERGEDRVNGDAFPERISTQNVEDRRRTEASIFSGEIEYDFTDSLSLTSVSAFIDSTVEYDFDADNLSIGPNEPGTTVNEDAVFSQELRLTYSDDRFDLLLGGYYFDSDGRFENNSTSIVGSQFALPDGATLAGLLFGTPTPSPTQIAQGEAVRGQIIAFAPNFPVVFDRNGDTNIRNYAVFGEATFRATEKLSFTVGSRFDVEEINQTSFDSTFVPPFPPSGDPVVDFVIATAASTFSQAFDFEADNEYEAFLPKGVIKYEWTDDFSTSVSVQRAYRAGGLSFNIFRGALAADTNGDGLILQDDLEALGIVSDFEPEFTTNYEFALRSQWFDRRLTLNANVYYIEYEDQQINVQLSSNPLDTLTDNVGASELFGFEIETIALPVSSLEVFANLGYSETEFTEDASFSSSSLIGLEFPNAPNWTVGFGGRYTFASDTFVNVRARYESESFAFGTNDASAINDDHFLVDLVVGYEADHYGLELFVTNLFDEEYISGNFGDPAGGSINYFGPPRVIGGRIVTSF